MNIRMIGIICVVIGCGTSGFMMANQYLANVRLVRNLVTALDYMQCELQYRGTALPQLCIEISQQVNGKIGNIFFLLAQDLDGQNTCDVHKSMLHVLQQKNDIYEPIRQILKELGGSMGKFDMSGQLCALENARNKCREHLNQLQGKKENCVRSYQTLGLCAGAAIAILLV